ncbi:MAG: K(+)-transporting ATPase subunit C [Bacteroidota bacterium]
MKENLFPAIKLTFFCLILFAGIYPAAVWCIAQFTPDGGQGARVHKGDKTWYANIGQSFTNDRYFYSRPSAVGYNAAGSGGSNKGPNNPDYLAEVQARVDTFLVHNPGVLKSDIPSDLVTASGSGLDPHISVQGALVQVKRIARLRRLSEADLERLVQEHTEKPFLGLFGTEKVNVLGLNLALGE